MKTLRQILFVPPAPIVWAQHLGLFAKHGIEVHTTQTSSSDELGQGLAGGTWDVGIGVMDNVIAWNHERRAGLQIAAQLERATIMAFCVAPRHATLAEVARDTIAVDSTSNGFVLVLYRSLARAGIDWHKCRYEALGGVRQRYEALEAGKASATILVPPFIDMALAKGFRKLWDGAEIAPDYPGVVVAARAEWLRENPSMSCYMGALMEANAWAPSNAEAAVQSLLAARYSEPAARRLVRDAVPGLRPSLAGWNETASLRRECGLMPVPEPQPEEIINRTWT